MNESGQHTMKYMKKIVPYTAIAAVGTESLFDSIICCPIFITSITPTKTTSEVVYIIRVIRFMLSGTSRLTICGIIMQRKI